LIGPGTPGHLADDILFDQSATSLFHNGFNSSNWGVQI
jgi:hypothetical protein